MLLAGEGAPDAAVANETPALALAAARAFLSASWSVQPASSPLGVTVEDFQWAAGMPTRILRRMSHPAATATTLSLPRGRHVLRLRTQPNTSHALSIWGAAPFEFGDAAPLLSAHEGLHFAEATAEIPAVPAGSWRVLSRHSFKLAAPARVQIQYRTAPAAAQRAVAVALIDNDTGAATKLVLGQRAAQRLQPNAGGYTLVAMQDATAAPAPAGAYRLRVASDAPLPELVSVQSSRCERFAGEYVPNRSGMVCRYALAPLAPCSIAVRVALSPPGLRARLCLEEAAGATAASGKGVKGAGAKGKPAADAPPPDTPKLVFSAAVSEEQAVPEIAVPAGRHVLSLRLERASSALELTPAGHIIAPVHTHAPRAEHEALEIYHGDDAAEALPERDAGARPPVSAAWILFVAPTADDKACPIALDNSHVAAQQAWLKSWVEQGPGGLKERPKRGVDAMAKLQELTADARGTLVRSPDPLLVCVLG
jgi:hypothetical protein